MGLDYVKIDACENNCMLYWKENSNRDECQVCGILGWKSSKGSVRGNKVPHKVLRYFPITPRLKRFFLSKKTASYMTWHHDKHVVDGLLRHPTYSKAWKIFDEIHKSFSSEKRNVRLGLASDGFNPYVNMSTSHNTWLVVLVLYNLPPWMCMKQSYFMLALLIPGPKGLGIKIDIYLQPLIDELNKLCGMVILFNITYGFKVNFCYSLIADKEVLLLHTKVDLVVALGGDGTVLWVCAFTFILAIIFKSECIITSKYYFRVLTLQLHFILFSFFW